MATDYSDDPRPSPTAAIREYDDMTNDDWLTALNTIESMLTTMTREDRNDAIEALRSRFDELYDRDRFHGDLLDDEDLDWLTDPAHERAYRLSPEDRSPDEQNMAEEYAGALIRAGHEDGTFLRWATPKERADYLAGYCVFDGAIETEDGLLIVDA